MSSNIRDSVADAMVQSGHKVSKRDADYGEGKMEAHCGICVHYRPASRSCEIVAGRIYADDWCKYFEKRLSDG